MPREPLSPDRDRLNSRRDGRSANKSPDEHSRNSKFDSHRGRISRGPRDYTNDRNHIDRNVPRYRDDGDDYRRPTDRGNGYKVLCVSNIYHKAPDADVRDALFRQFKKFGEVSIKVVHEANERVAYVYFTCYEDAREARHAKAKMILFDKQVMVDPVAPPETIINRKSRRSCSPDYGYGRGMSPPNLGGMGRRSGGGGGGSRYPIDLDRELGPPPPLPPHRDFNMRKDYLPHEYPPGYHLADRRHDQPKKEKFPNYLHHVPPEEDDKATRTLFVGNLEVNITEPELRRIFERYGVVEDIDVKRPPPGQGNAYAFVKFLNLDMAHRAKVEMSGQYVGKFQCKIGYGKANPTTRLWVGGLGSWTSLSHLEREFDRFGAIRKIDFVKGENQAYILYDSIDAAQAACQEMRGFPLGGPDRRLRVDFADSAPYNYQMQQQQQQQQQQSPSRGNNAGYRSQPDDRVPPEPYGAPAHVRGAGRLPPADDHYYVAPPPLPPPPPPGNRWNVPYTYESHERTPSNRREPWDGRSGGDYARRWSGGHDANAPWHDDYLDGKGGSSVERRKRPHSPFFDHDDYKRHRSRTPDYVRPGRDRTPQSGLRQPRSPQHEYSRNRRELSTSPMNGAGDRIARHGSSDRPDKFSSDVERGEIEESEGVSKETLFAAAIVRQGCIGGLDVAENVSNLHELAKCFPVTWHGGLVLKNSSFATRMHLCSGDVSLVDSLMKDKSTDVNALRITQRLRLEKPKLDDVARRITSSGSNGHYCMMLALPGSAAASGQPQGDNIQQRPLRNLVTYLKQKEAAGVIALPSGANIPQKEGKDSCGVLYAFPPCEFSLTLLRCIAPKIKEDVCKEQDHLTVIVVRGAS